ncbi:MAG: hypothetical protein E6767_14065 [Dysgonomonas sp.]|nr:hypothetical protein [Dysgonomonas sp.]
MKNILLFLLICILPVEADACLNAHIFKIFPVGIYNDTIVSVDIDIWRNEMLIMDGEDSFRNSIDLATSMPSETSWRIRTYITKYDSQQKPIKSVAIDSVYFQKEEYSKELQILYERAYKRIVSENPEIELFKPKDISFCDLKYKHKYVKLEDGILSYKKKDYPISIVRDSTYYPFASDSEYRDMMTSSPLPPINSIRKYSSDKAELIVIHLQIGQLLMKKKKPSIKFKDIENAVYEEPILYHGHGYDIFVLQKL